MHYSISQKYIDETLKYEELLKEKLNQTNLDDTTKKNFFELIMCIQTLADYYDTLVDEYNSLLSENEKNTEKYNNTYDKNSRKNIHNSILKNANQMKKIKKKMIDLNDLSSSLLPLGEKAKEHMEKQMVVQKTKK